MRLFPSPAGGFFISSLRMEYVVMSLEEFPSPAGVLFISSSVLLSESGQIYVSVPCWGLFYFIILNVKQNMKSCQYCFRPLTGSFLFHPNNSNDLYLQFFEFPSPAGVFFISSQTNADRIRNMSDVSVPCRGLFYFINTLFNSYIRPVLFPSPDGVFFISSFNEEFF